MGWEGLKSLKRVRGVKSMKRLYHREEIVAVEEDHEWHALGVEEVTRLLNTTTERGLASASVQQLAYRFGPNDIRGQGGVNPWRVLGSQFTNGMTIILALSTAVSFSVDDYAEAALLAFIITFNAIVGFVQEHRAEKTMEALRQMSAGAAKVIRDGVLTKIPGREVVPGDMILLEVGDVVPADCRLVEVQNLEVNESMLTGESIPVMKSSEPIKRENVTVADRLNMVYTSTTLTRGKGKAVVVETGMGTEIGKICEAIGGKTKLSTPMRKSLNRLAYVVFLVAIVLAFIAFTVNLFDFEDPIVVYAVGLSISVVPEGLLSVITIAMIFGVKRVTKQRAVIRKLGALESLHAVTNICTDKTGTLTENKMSVTKIWQLGKGMYSVSGVGYSTHGEISLQDKLMDLQACLADASFRHIVECCALCNTATVVEEEESSEGGEEVVKVKGDPTEIALQLLAHKFQMGQQTYRNVKEVIKEFPFTSSTMRTSMMYRDCTTTTRSPACELYVKGTEALLSMCEKVMDTNGAVTEITSKDEFVQKIDAQIEDMAKVGLRVLVLAYRRVLESELGSPVTKWERSAVEQKLVFLGLVGLEDAPRPDSKMAVEQCFDAGITVHMLTGDHLHTAIAVAREVGIIRPQTVPSEVASAAVVVNISPPPCPVMSASEFDALSEEEIDKLPELPLVIARCTPTTKVRMIEALHRRHKFVAMTGDGVNDAPSLKEADVGIAMGGGSNVAKQSSDIVLTDNHFSTIVRAIAEGRRIYFNIRKIVLHLVSTNVAEGLVLLVGLAFKDRSGTSVFPLSAVQILYMNMISSTPPAIALGLEPGPSNIMKVPPTRGGLFGTEMIVDIFAYGLIMGSLILTNWSLVIYTWGNDELAVNCNGYTNVDDCNTVFRARSTILVAFTWMLLLHAYNCRHVRASMFRSEGGGGWNFSTNKVLILTVVIGFLMRIPVIYIPWVNSWAFKQSPIDTWEWGVVIISTVAFIAFSEMYKFIKRRILKHKEL